jgi:catechol 2,3-dioxygenase
MPIKSLGHVVLKVRSLDLSVPFYRDVLGLREVARYGGRMVFFSLGSNHHDLALAEVGPQAPLPNPAGVGLYHVAFKVGDSLQELRDFKAHLERHGVAILGMSDHRVSQSLYIRDPDGIEIELYVDAEPALWRDNPQAVATVEPLDLN